MRWIFVYDADSGAMNAALDWAHKLVSPSTYRCALCAVTYSAWGRKPEWDAALGRLPGTKEFYHRDEFRDSFPGRAVVAPSVWSVREGQWTQVLGPGDWGGIDTIADLEARLNPSLLRRA